MKTRYRRIVDLGDFSHNIKDPKTYVGCECGLSFPVAPPYGGLVCACGKEFRLQFEAGRLILRHPPDGPAIGREPPDYSAHPGPRGTWDES